MEEEITHFSHEHSLTLIKHPPPALEEQSNDVEIICRCYGCKEPVLADEEAYRCERRGCETIFLHKQCAQLPREIMLPLHDQHSLILFPSPPFGRVTSGTCDVCRAKLDGFNYYCSICDFNMDVKCAVKEKEALFVYINKKFKHPSHEHLLVYQPRPTSFRCNACNVEDKDLSYQCSEYGCPFWIHKSCALLPNNAQRNDHVHPDTDERDAHLGILQLIYKLPSEYHSYYFHCDVCRGKIRPMHWAYFCRPCRYFVHIKCMTSPKLKLGDKFLYDDDDATFEDRMLKLLLPVDFLHLPVVDVSIDMIQRFLLNKNCLKNIQPAIEDFGHQHPLTLCCGNPGEGEDERITCDACITPLSSTHYSCAECRFFLHLQCAELPVELQHPSHPHPLTLTKSKRFYDTFLCDICHLNSNGYFFGCKSMGCKFRIDIKCACIQTMISHETHDHPLFRSIPDSTKKCSGCGWRLYDLDLFGCEPCNFYLHLHCVMLPKKFEHRFDCHHRLELSFPPYPDHPEQIDCLECEKEANPNEWLYRCKECDLSFHTWCTTALSNTKFDQNIQIDSHIHPLKFVRDASVKSPCHDCGVDIDKFFAFECETCNFHLCRPCVHRIDS